MKIRILLMVAAFATLLLTSCTKQNTTQTGSPEKLIAVSVKNANSIIYPVTIDDQIPVYAAGSHFPIQGNQTIILSTNVANDSARVKVFVQMVAGDVIRLTDKHGSYQTTFDVTQESNENTSVLFLDKRIGLDKNFTPKIEIIGQDADITVPDLSPGSGEPNSK